MSDPYERAKTGRLTFKGGSLATLKSIDKKKSKKKSKNKKPYETQPQTQPLPSDEIEITPDETNGGDDEATASGEVVYTIDAARRMKYDDLFPVEAKKFGYDPVKAKQKSVEEALDDRVKKKADRYCK
ncbi:hypothetical protein GIB67_006272 [Kingdonia uniflora]|uniref:Uncharacterized protein n=1 Tax=Kingdonia uniflora TaxID=39325 RepID=A0A7J7P5K5_9MAGN|nr:hypothetical protein GIB67_006272 [Kingdonia uniflora]